MEIAVEKIGDVAVVVLPVEELDAGNAGKFKRDIAPLLEANTKLVFDLSDLRFADTVPDWVSSCLVYGNCRPKAAT